MCSSTEYDSHAFRLTADLGDYQDVVDSGLRDIQDKKIVSRLWEHDHTIWKPQPDEIGNRLGWLDVVPRIEKDLSKIEALTREVISAGYTHAILLGMGGSSLAAEVFRKTFGVRNGYLDLNVLDTTDPDTIKDLADRLNPGKTLFIVSTKSGGTIETLSFYKYFLGLTAHSEGWAKTGNHFIAITDPGSSLADEAESRGFRALFLSDPEIGGRYSALSFFGLVPAALIGVDINRLLERAKAIRSRCFDEPRLPISENPGAYLGTILGELAKAGRDKLTLLLPSNIESFTDWVEQLIAESTGKEGKGILPVVNESLGVPSAYGNDRLFIRFEIEKGGDPAPDRTPGGHPEVRIHLHDRYDLGGQMFLWEYATAVAGERMGINPFDQPDVEAAKEQARRIVSHYEKDGFPPIEKPSATTASILSDFLKRSKPGDYIALQAYLKSSPETDAALKILRRKLRDCSRLAVTLGYGPRYLHSTGQLHKGDGGRGHFILLTAGTSGDLPIPSEPGSDASLLSFGILKMAQALGDQHALQAKGRHIIRIHLSAAPAAEIMALSRLLD